VYTFELLGRKEWLIVSYSIWLKNKKRYAGLSGYVEMKKQLVTAFLDISGAYDHVLIVYCVLDSSSGLRM
jgi:hypothetical protein